MTPSEELTAAAKHIRAVAGKANPGPWHHDLGNGYVHTGYTEVVDVAVTGNGDHIALFDPDTAELTAAMFDKWAWMSRLDSDLIHRIGGDETLALARKINEKAGQS